MSDRRVIRRVATAVGIAAFGAYVVWNIWWLAQGLVPPAIFRWLTGLPAPTTGGARSSVALWHGEVARSLHYNPMTVPIVALMVVTVAMAMIHRGRAPGWCAAAWVITLMIAWIFKLISPVDTW